MMGPSGAAIWSSPTFDGENNLGIVLWRLGERESGTARLEEAVAAFRAALEEYTASAFRSTGR
jgi:hypothetical protein